MRIYRVGDGLLAFELLCDDLDYRKHHRVVIRPMAVPPDVAPALVRLCDDLGLDFAAADFMLDGDDSWIFLEVNSQPMFAAFDATMDGALSDLLIDWLPAGRTESADQRLVA